MPALNTDKFVKVAPNTGWQLGASGISDAVVDNFALVSASGLPTDTAVILTIDRVDSGGVKTPAKMERIKGVVSGNNIINAIRGYEGTAQAHSGGAVVEILISKSNVNDAVDGILAEHNQDGSHKSETIKTIIHAATEKTTPVDADEFALIDSADSNNLKKLTYGNLKKTVSAPRVGTEVSSSTSTPTGDTVNTWTITSLATNDAIAAPTGTPVDGQKLIIRIKDNGTARTITWNAIYRGGTDIVLPSTTVINKTLYCGFIYNSADNKWDLVAITGNI